MHVCWTFEEKGPTEQLGDVEVFIKRPPPPPVPGGGVQGMCLAGCRSPGRLKQVEKAQCISVARQEEDFKKQTTKRRRIRKEKSKLSCVGCRTVLVCISSKKKCVDRRECWTCAWLPSLIVIVLILLMHCRTTRYRVYSQNQHISVDGELSFTVYKNTSWRQNVADTFVQTIVLFPRFL